MKPFADDSASAAVGGLTLENGRDRIAVYGTLDLTRDQAGLAHAQALKLLLDQAIAVMQADAALPAAVPPAAKPGTVRNPFS